MSDSRKEITLEHFVNAISELKKQPKFANKDKHTLARYAYEHLFFCAEKLAELDGQYESLRKWFTFLFGTDHGTKSIVEAAKYITACKDDDDAYDELYQLLVVTVDPMFNFDGETYPQIGAQQLLSLWDRYGVPEHLLHGLKSDYARMRSKESATGDNEVEIQ
jgi:hypothetical protein